MTLLTLLPILAVIPVLIVTLAAMKTNGRMPKNAWMVAVFFCIALTAWTIPAVLSEGLLGFIPAHSQSLWGNQVWFDLLMALTMAWVLILPRAKTLRMNLPLWLLFILCTGSIGFSAMLARMLFLEERQA
ncbi:MAG: hypothetical protein ABJO36_13890 [Litorimonas sp.]